MVAHFCPDTENTNSYTETRDTRLLVHNIINLSVCSEAVVFVIQSVASHSLSSTISHLGSWSSYEALPLPPSAPFSLLTLTLCYP